MQFVQVRSDLEVQAPETYWVELQVVAQFLQTRFVVGVHGLASYCEDVH